MKVNEVALAYFDFLESRAVRYDSANAVAAAAMEETEETYSI